MPKVMTHWNQSLILWRFRLKETHPDNSLQLHEFFTQCLGKPLFSHQIKPIWSANTAVKQNKKFVWKVLALYLSVNVKQGQSF